MLTPSPPAPELLIVVETVWTGAVGGWIQTLGERRAVLAHKRMDHVRGENH